MSKWEKVDPADINVGDRVKKVYTGELPDGNGDYDVAWFTVTEKLSANEWFENVKDAKGHHSESGFYSGDRSSTYYRKVKKVKPSTTDNHVAVGDTIWTTIVSGNGKKAIVYRTDATSHRTWTLV